jgi:hypothetical protein
MPASPSDSAAPPEPSTAPGGVRFRRAALGFWIASLGGFVGYGALVAGVAAAGLDGGPAPAGEAARAGLALGLSGALLLGAPAAALFGGVMRRVAGAAVWPSALATGAALSGALYAAFATFAGAIADQGCAGEPAVAAAAAALAMMAGAVSGAAAGRPGRALAIAPGGGLEGT